MKHYSLLVKHYLKLIAYYIGILKIINKQKHLEFANNLKKNKYSLCAEKEKIKNKPRYKEGVFIYNNLTINYVDSASFLFMFHEIFEKQIYYFISQQKKPKIIDCGANIGLSVLYFNYIIDNAQIIAFEPDAKIFKVLQKNTIHLPNVQLFNKAVWNEETKMYFLVDGADGGRIYNNGKNNNSIVETIRLKDFLYEKIDFLKIDIEGAETIVMHDCAKYLGNVENIFIEYHSSKEDKQTLHEILSILTHNGFRYYIERVGVVFSKPFVENRTKLDFDLQLNIFGYRL